MKPAAGIRDAVKIYAFQHSAQAFVSFVHTYSYHVRGINYSLVVKTAHHKRNRRQFIPSNL